MPDKVPKFEARVLRAHSGRYEVLDASDQLVSCRSRRRLRRPNANWPVFPVAGDRVECRRLETADAGCAAVIEAVLPRASEIARVRAGKKHVVVANLDLLVVVVSVQQPALDRGLLDRLLATAERTGIRACVCLHKIDLAAPGEFDAVQAIYEAAGYPVLATSAVTGAGVDALRDALRGHVCAFMGASGAGKSRLITSLQPGLELRTGGVSEKTGQGRHTTTRVDLHRTDFGALLADTPGIREFSLWRLPAEELRGLFPEFREIEENCHFARCTHDHEPHCAVKRAVDEGRLDPGRHRSYLAILADLLDDARAGAGRRKRKDRFT